MNRALLLQVAKRIEAHPEKYNQGSFCGTACCIAGHAVLEGEKRNRFEASDRAFPLWIGERARSLLKLTLAEAGTLFDSVGASWPEPYASDMGATNTKKQRATVAAKFLRALARGKVRI